MLKKEFVAQKPQKLSAFLCGCGFAFSQVCKMLRKKDVRVDGKPTNADVLLAPQQKVTVFFSPRALPKDGATEEKGGEIFKNGENKNGAQNENAENCQNAAGVKNLGTAQNGKMLWEKVFEGENVLVVYKYDGIESVGENSLQSALGAIAVHRLDRNTQGLMVFAKNEKAAEILKSAFRKHLICKCYLAEVVGKFETDQTHTAYLLKNPQTATVKIFGRKTKGAVEICTKVKTLKAGPQTSLVQVWLITGKTHQIRAHLAFLGHPIVGDGKYGKNADNKKFGQKHQKLAAFRLEFGKIGIDEIDNARFEKFPDWIGNLNLKI